jgi:predicted TIM-barrel fold metal-dependent hydrolase
MGAVQLRPAERDYCGSFCSNGLFNTHTRGIPLAFRLPQEASFSHRGMKHALKILVAGILLSGVAILAVDAAHSLPAKYAGPAMDPLPPQTAPVAALTPYVDTHVHFDGDAQTVVQAALQALGRENAAKLFFLSPPDTFDTPNRLESDFLVPVFRQHADKLAILAGGGTLNAMIQQSVKTGDAGPDAQRRFRERAQEIIRMGAVGFGEMATEHFAGDTPYQYAPNDHPLFLLLSDIAAETDAPIVIHMELAEQDMSTPALLGPPNPRQIHGNLAAFERFLAHNRRARIVWAHFGSDALGQRTPEQARRLLRANPNLFMEIKADPLNPRSNYPLDANGKIKPEYLRLFTEYPDRFVIGSDQHYPEPRAAQQRWQTVVNLFNQLPADVRKKIGTENAARVYPLSMRRPAN